MRCLWIMFVTAVCFLFLLKLKWPKNKNIYEALFKEGKHLTVVRRHSVALKNKLQTKNTTSNNNKKYTITKEELQINIKIYNYSLSSIEAFCSSRKDLKTLCLKLASEPLFLIWAFMQFHFFFRCQQSRCLY